MLETVSEAEQSPDFLDQKANQQTSEIEIASSVVDDRDDADLEEIDDVEMMQILKRSMMSRCLYLIIWKSFDRGFFMP